MGQKHFPGAQKCKSTINQRGRRKEEARGRGREKQAEEQTPKAVSPLTCWMLSQGSHCPSSCGTLKAFLGLHKGFSWVAPS